MALSSCTHPRPALAALALTLALSAAATPAPAAPEKDAGRQLHWRRTYLEALLEARVRAVPVLVFRQKDECGRCERQRSAVLLARDFVRFANEHVVAFVAHNERLHDTVEVEVDGEKVQRCSRYAGLTCRDHVRAAVDVDNAREEGMVQVPFQELHPNTWLVLPTGEVEPVAEQDQFDPAKIEEQVKAVQERLGDALPAKAFPPCRDLLARAEAAADEDRWKDALEALAGLEGVVPKPPSSLVALVQQRLRALDEAVGFAAEDALAAPVPDAEERELVHALLAATDVPVYGERLPVRDALSAWRARHP
jgi:hypothetical protein